MVHVSAPLSETGRLRLGRCVVDEVGVTTTFSDVPDQTRRAVQQMYRVADGVLVDEVET